MIKKVLCAMLLATMLVAAGALADAAGDGYQSLASGLYDSGTVIPAGGYYVTVSVVNGSNAVNVIVNGPSVPDNDKAPRNVVKGSSAYYGNYLRVYIVDVVGNKTYVDISQPGGGSSGTASGTKVTCDTPGLTALAGGVVTFPISIQNNDNSDHTYTLRSSSDLNWKTWFNYGQKGVYMISVPAQ